MAVERSGAVTFKGEPMTLVGNEVKVGDPAPEFSVTGTDMSAMTLADTKGKVRLLSVVPSLDTSVCSIQTRRFNDEAKSLGDDVEVLTLSMDLPFAQSRWLEAENVEHLATASDYKNREFGQNWGVYVKELGLLARSIFVVDKNDKVVYVEIVPEMTDEPAYDAAINVVKAALR